MKNKKFLGVNFRRIIASFSLALLSTFGLALPAYAASGSIYAVANKSSVVNGSSVVVAIYMNGGGNNVNAVQANVSYSADKLQYVGVNYSGSAFDIAAANSGGGGNVSIARGKIGTVTGVGLVATITFKAVAVGSASVDIAGGSALAADGGEVAASTSGVRLNVVAPSAAAPSVGASATSTAPATPSPKDTTPPVITDIAATKLTPSSATISWTTNEASDTVVEYGLDTNYGLSTSVATQTTKHEAALNSSFLVPLTSLHYRVKSTDAAGNAQTSPDQTLGVPGIPVSVIIRGADGRPQVGASVTLDNQTKTTNDKGAATFETGVGNKQILTSYAGVTIRKSITVTNSAKPLPPFELSLAARPADRWMLVSAGLAILVFALLLLDAYLFGSKYLSRFILGRIPKKRLEAIPVVAAAGPTPNPDAAKTPVSHAAQFAPTAPKVFVHPPSTFAASPVVSSTIEKFNQPVVATPLSVEERIDSFMKPEPPPIRLKTPVTTSYTMPEENVAPRVTAPPVAPILPASAKHHDIKPHKSVSQVKHPAHKTITIK